MFWVLWHINLCISLMSRVFAGRPGFNKTQTIVLDVTLLNTQYYKVRIKGKVELSTEWSNSLPYILV